MNPSCISCFLSVARTGSFSATAEELHLTRQAVSKNIRDLEKEFGFPLFHRRCVSLTLTVAGMKLYQHYSSLDYNLGSIRRIFSRTVNQGFRLQLGWGSWVKPQYALIDDLTHFSAAKGVVLGATQGQEAEILEYLRTGEIDVAFISRYMSSFLRERYTMFPVAEIPVQFGVARSKSAAANGEIESLVRSSAYLTCRAAEETEAEIIGRASKELLDSFGFLPEIRILPNLETVFLQVMLGNGFTCCPDTATCGYSVDIYELKRSITLSMVWLNRNTNRNIHALQQWFSRRGGG